MGRNLHTWLDEHKMAMRLVDSDQSAIAGHRIQTGHQLDLGGTRVLDVMPNKHPQLMLEAWHVKEQRGGAANETIDFPVQYNLYKG